MSTKHIKKAVSAAKHKVKDVKHEIKKRKEKLYCNIKEHKEKLHQHHWLHIVIFLAIAFLVGLFFYLDFWRNIDYRGFGEAVKTSIKKMSKEERDWQSFQYAVEMEDSDLCGDIKDDVLRENCKISTGISAAIGAEDIKFCDSVKDEMAKENCRNSIFLKEAVRKENARSCWKIKDKGRKDSCLDRVLVKQVIKRKSVSGCLKLNEGERENCILNAAFGSARGGNEDLCDKISDNDLKKECSLTAVFSKAKSGDSEICRWLVDEKEKQNCFGLADGKDISPSKEYCGLCDESRLNLSVRSDKDFYTVGERGTFYVETKGEPKEGCLSGAIERAVYRDGLLIFFEEGFNLGGDWSYSFGLDNKEGGEHKISLRVVSSVQKGGALCSLSNNWSSLTYLVDAPTYTYYGGSCDVVSCDEKWDADTGKRSCVGNYTESYQDSKCCGNSNFCTTIQTDSKPPKVSILSETSIAPTKDFFVDVSADDDLSGLAEGKIELKTNNGSWQPYLDGLAGFSFEGKSGDVYRFRFKARDGAGNWSNYALSNEIRVNAPPTAYDLSYNDPDYCRSVSFGILNWRYGDQDGSAQGAYRIQIDDDPQFASPDQDTSINSSSNSHLISPLGLSFSSIYYWRVKVTDSFGAKSDWIEGPDFYTALHRYPDVKFDYLPKNPLITDVIKFSDKSMVFGDTVVIDRSWDFGDPSFGLETIEDKNPVYQYDENEFEKGGEFKVNLTVIDSDGYQCTGEKTIKVGAK